jgi:hypothetical protein
MEENMRNLVVKLKLDASTSENQKIVSDFVATVAKAESSLTTTSDKAREIAEETKSAQKEVASSIVESVKSVVEAREESAKTAVELAEVERIQAEALSKYQKQVGEEIRKENEERLSRQRAMQAEALANYETRIEMERALSEADSRGTGRGSTQDEIQAVRDAELALHEETRRGMNTWEQYIEVLDSKFSEALSSAEESLGGVNSEIELVHEETASLERANAGVSRSLEVIATQSRQFVGGMTSIARSYVLATVAGEDNQKAALQTIAGFESVAQGITGTIEAVQSGIQMWEEYRNIVESVDTIHETLRSGGDIASILRGSGAAGAGGLSGAARAGGLAAGAGGATGSGGLAAIGAIAAPVGAAVAAFAAVTGSVLMFKERMDGTNFNDGSLSKTISDGLESVLSSTFGNLLARASPHGMLVAAATQGPLAEKRESEERLKAQEERLEKARERETIADGMFQRRAALSAAKEKSDLNKGRFSAGFGLDGIKKELATNQFEKQFIQGRMKEGEIFEGSRKSREAFLTKSLRDNETLQKLAHKRYELIQKESTESIKAAEKKLKLAQDELTVAEKARDKSKTKLETATDRLAGLDSLELTQLRRSIGKARQGENLSFEETKHLKGLGFDDAIRDNRTRLANINDRRLGGGILDPFIENFNNAQDKVNEIQLNVNQQNNLVIELKKTGDELVAEAMAKLGDEMKTLFSQESQLREQVAKLTIALQERQN